MNGNVPEAALGDFVADVNELTKAYEAVLDMSLNISSGIQNFPAGNFYFPGENLNDKDCSFANITKPQYSIEIMPLVQNTDTLMQNVKQKTDRLSEQVNLYIESLRALNSQIDAMFSYSLPLIKSNKLSEFSNINPNIIDANFIESLIGTMSYEEYERFIIGIEQYYDREIASKEKMLEGYNELLDPVLNFLTGQGIDIERDLINYDNYIASGLFTEESKVAYIELINSQVKERFGDKGINTYEELIQYRQTLDYYIGVTSQLIDRDKEQKGSAEYDYLMFLEDFQNYKENYISTLPTEVMEKEDLRDLMIASKYNPDFKIVYNYLYDKNPEDAVKYKQAVQYQINDIQGQIMARDFLKWLDENDGRLDIAGGIWNERIVGVKGILDGVYTFGEGVVYSAEAVSNLFQKYILKNEIRENRIMSVNEYARNYILQALLSEKDKIGIGLITEEDGNYISTSPYQIIDYTKDYSGILLSNNYKLNQGIGNMLPSILLSTVNPAVGSIALGVSSGGNSYHSAMVEGYSLERSVFYGILSGSTEAITERFLGGLPGLSETKVTNVSTWLKAIAKEGNEEVYQDFMDMAFRAIALGEEIQIPSTMEEFKEALMNRGETWLYGAVTAGILQSSSIAVSSVNPLDMNNNSNSKVNNDSLEIKKVDSRRIDIVKGKLKENFNKTLILKDTNDFYSNYYKFYKEERNGITFVSDTKEDLNILLNQYEDTKKNSNIITRLYLKYLENGNLKITNIKFDYSQAFQLDDLVVLEKKGSVGTFFHETSHFRDWLIDYLYISPSIYKDALDKIRNNPKKINYFMKYCLDALKVYPNVLAYQLKISNKSKYSTALTAVSDIFDAIYKGKLLDYGLGLGGHGSEYYKYRGNDAIEIFANVGHLINTEYSDLLYKYFPKDFADSLIQGYYNSVFYKGGILESDFSDVDDINSIIHFAITGDLSRVKKARLTNILESNPKDAILAAFSPKVAYNYLDQLRIIDPSLTNQLEKYAKTGDFKEIKNSSAIVYLNYLKADVLKLYLSNNFGELHTNFNQNKLGTIPNEFKSIIEINNNNNEYIKGDIEKFKIEFLNNLNSDKLQIEKINGITFVSSTKESLNELVSEYKNIKQNGNLLMKLYLNTLENSYTFLTNIKINESDAFQVGNIINITDARKMGNFFTKSDNFKAIRDAYVSPTIYKDALTKIAQDPNLWNYFVNFNQQGNNMDIETYLKISFIYNAIYNGKLADNSQINYDGLTLLKKFNSEYFKYIDSGTSIYRIVSDLVGYEKSDVLYQYFPKYFAESLLIGYYNTPIYTPYNFENNLNSIFDVNEVLNYVQTGDLSAVNNNTALANMLKYNLEDVLVAITSPNVVFRYFDQLCKIDPLLMNQLVEYVNTKNLNMVKNYYAQKYLPYIGIDILKIYVNENI